MALQASLFQASLHHHQGTDSEIEGFAEVEPTLSELRVVPLRYNSLVFASSSDEVDALGSVLLLTKSLAL
jgi:hypothetical protein